MTEKLLLFLSLFLFLTTNSAHAGGRLKGILEFGKAHHCPAGFERLEGLETVSVPTKIKTGRFELKTVTNADFEEVKKIWGNEEVAKMSGDYMGDSDIQGLLSIGRPS